MLGSVGALAAAMGEDAARVAFAVNGGMYDNQGRPIGYYVENGERLQRLNRHQAHVTVRIAQRLA